MSPENSKQVANKRTVCDHCRRRRIRCDGEFPCNQCTNAALSCKREHVPKRRGPKRGSGRVINELRAQDEVPKIKVHTRESSNGTFSSGPPSIDNWLSDHSNSTSPTLPQHPRWHPIMSDVSQLHDEPTSIFTSDQFRPTSPNYFHLIPTCIDLFTEHIYPIMPLIHMPSVREFVARTPEMFEKNLLYALCALTSTHMSGKSILAPGPPCWEAAGRFFLDECISVRQSYDFVEDKSLYAVISSYFVSTAFFELNQSRKSWYYLREALTMGQDLRFHDENSYAGLPEAEALCRRRTFWILYVTERSFAILRHKPLTLSKTPAYPTTIHDYETPSIHTGFMHLVNAYHLLDNSFVDSWNEASNSTTSLSTYTSLQSQLSQPFAASPTLPLTDIQKADILVTQQWLRLIIWQSSMRQGLLSSTSEDESMTFSYPMKIAESLLGVISSLPQKSIEVHGMGIMEKIFEIGNSMLDVMQACGQGLPALEELYGVGTDPFGLFIKTLSRTPNSQKQYANLLLQKAAEKPEVLRFSSGLGAQISNPPATQIPPANGVFEAQNGSSVHLASPVPTRQWRGSIVGEIDDNGNYTLTEEAMTQGDEQLDGSVTWSSDAVWISDSTEPSARDRDQESREQEEDGINGLKQVNAKNVFIGANGGAEAFSELDAMVGNLERSNTLQTHSSVGSTIDDDDDGGVMDERDDDIDWGFAVKLEV